METTTITKTIRCVIVTPERAVLDEAVDFVAVPAYDGELGVLPGRTPLIARLGFGELRTVKGKKVERFYIDGGFAQIRGDVVTVLTPKALRSADIKLAGAEAELQAAQKATESPEALEIQAKAQQRARAKIRIAQREQSEDNGLH